MKEQGYEQLTLFQEDSRASRFPLPGSVEARTTTVTSGRKCSESYGKSGPLGCLVRMCLESSIWHSTRCFLTWKTQSTKHNRLLFRLAVSTRRISESESQLWPIPPEETVQRTLRKMLSKGMITEEELNYLSQGSGTKTDPELQKWLTAYTKAFTGLIPTTISRDWKGAPAYRYVGGQYYRSILTELAEATPRGIIGRLNPEWIEWLTGYPIGWTELNV